MKTISKSYLIRTYSPYWGEEDYYEFNTNSIVSAIKAAKQYVKENAKEWYDDQAKREYGDKFWDECGYDIIETTTKTYRKKGIGKL